MRAVVQRVSSAEVRVGGQIVGAIGKGLLVLLAVQYDDGPADLEFIKRKLTQLRIFNDPEGKMNLDIRAVGGEFLVVSQFTLYGDCRKGNRPSFTRSAPPEVAEAWYERLVTELRAAGFSVATGRFQAMMEVALVNDGPVTLIVDSRKEFY
ncbi:MAG: D-aminoacyl-tRNA deacylase [Acidobacteriota bacterium]